MRLAAEGLTAKATAKALQISESAVNLYLTNARHKLGAKTKARAFALLIEAGPLLSENIEQLRDHPGAIATKQSQHADDQKFMSNQLRHLLDDISMAEFSHTANKCDDTVWNELADQFLRTAAAALGYGIIRHHEGDGPERRQLTGPRVDAASGTKALL